MAELWEQLQATLGGAYTLERELGGGGMSRVFVATERRLGRRVVVKVLRSEIAAGTSAERFEREMALCARCHHPHIVPLLAAGEVGGLPWFTMPLVEGESLRDRLERQGPLPVGEAVRLLTEVADALAYAHRLGIVHRDIKPENILLHDGHAVVADFGVAKAFHAATRAELPSQATGVGVVIGTPAYMAPEQAMGDAGVDHRVDLYALGVVAFELLTGQHPFSGMTPQAILAAQLNRTPPPIARARPECPPGLAALIGRLLAREPADRPATAEEVRAELLALAGGAAAHAGSRPPGRRVWLAVGAPFLAASLLLIALAARHRPNPRPAPASGDAGVKSLAVLPFQNIGGDSTTNYFSDGLAEELISALGRLGGLRVASRTSAFAAKARSGDLREIGQRLAVATVLESSVRRDGPRVRVTTRLVDVARDSQLWTGEYESRLENVFAVQDTIAHAIAGALRITLARGGGARLVAQGTADPEAHDLYLRGREFLANRTPVSLRKAIDAFRAALARDSTYALAQAGLADAYSLAVPFGGFYPAEAIPLAETAAHRALALDSTLAEVHVSLGIIAMFHDWDWREASRRLSRAVQLNPSSAQARLFHAWYLLLTGRPEEGLAEVERARTLDPLSLIINTRVASFLHFMGRDAEAIPAFQRALALDSTFAPARAGLALSYAELGRFKEALSLPAPLESLLGTFEAGTFAAVQAMAGRPFEARRILGEMETVRKQRYMGAEGFADVRAVLGDTDAAFAELERGYRERAFTLVTIRVEPMLAPLHADPRWGRLMARLNFPPAPTR
ncbi:MAG TPA: protein kinase [Gemmatimonadales bacterium]|jgi:serine/threonine-protein kinase|nr:protein kinase [Gemmatimonadales bacterium]